jgi:hypothetical protein
MNVPGWITHLKRPRSLWGTVVGWLCVCIGVLGIVLPIIPGLPFLAAGLFILSARYVWAAVCLRWLKRKARSASAYVSRRKEADSNVASTNRG